MRYLWGWAEIGYACELQHAVTKNRKLNTHRIGKAAAAIIDLPTLMQRGWIMAHEVAHTLGVTHKSGDPLADGSFQPDLALKDYIAGCSARSEIFQACHDGSFNNTKIQYHSCD